MGANTTELYAAWEEEGSGGTHVACYAGLFGRCHECDIAGSCICGKYRNGMSDFVPMDRREFGQRVLLCPNLEPVLIILYSVACLAALILLPQTISGVRFQLRQARSQTSANHPRAPLVVMSTALAGTVSILVFSAMKLILPDRVVGADPIISFVLAVRHAASAVGFEAHLTHLVNVARASQERSLGRQRVADAMARRFHLSFVKVIQCQVIG
uniref:Uncharacterized protein n=1 Tax=Chrysotila carterae TaxID=13221 RepID=A0A6S9UFV5_CHRCT